MAFLDAYTESVRRYWPGNADPATLRIDLRADPDSDPAGKVIGAGAAWVAFQHTLGHELNHLITFQEDGTSSPFFNEGIAVAIGPSDVLAAWSPYYDTEPQTFVFSERFDSNFSQYYPEFGALTHFLIQTYGLETYRDAYLATHPDMTSVEQEEVFVDVFGDGIYDTFDEYLEAPKCALRTWQCDEDVLPVYTLPFEIGRSTMACDDDPQMLGFHGPDPTDWYPERRFMLDVPQGDSVYVAHIENVSVFRMHCTSCAGGLTEIGLFSADRIESGDDFRRRMLEPGRHSLHVRVLDPSRPFALRLEQRE